MDDWNDWIYFWAMMACGGLSAFPFRLARGWRAWPVFLMGLGLGIFLLGGSGEPMGDMAATALMMFLWLNGMAKLGLLQVWTAWTGGSRRRMRALPQRRILLATAAAILLGCAQWFSSLGGSWTQLRVLYGMERLRSVQSARLSGADNAAVPLPKTAARAGGG